MSAGIITIKQRSDTTVNFHFTNNGTDVDLTNKIVYLTVKQEVSQAVPDIAKAISVHDDATAGTTSTVISSTDSNIEPRLYRYDIQIVDTGGSITASDIGSFIVEPTVR